METKETEGKGLGRRSFLKWTGLSLLTSNILSFINPRISFANGLEVKKNYWRKNPDGEDYCVHNRVRMSSLSPDYIYAKVDNWWRKYPVREIQNEFMEWYLEEKLRRYQDMREGNEIWWGGHHHPAVATYGNRRGRGDSMFHLNNTSKGVGVCPKYEKLVEVNDYIENHQDLPGQELLAYLENLYSDPDNFDPTKLVSIEYYTKNPDLERVTGYKETHTFLNMMENPMCNLCFLAVWKSNYGTEIRAIPYLIDPANPNLTEEEKQYVKYPTNLYTWYHKKEASYIACYYFVVETFSQGTLPSDSNEPGRGVRVVPPPPVWLARFKERVKTLFGRS